MIQKNEEGEQIFKEIEYKTNKIFEGEMVNPFFGARKEKDSNFVNTKRAN